VNKIDNIQFNSLRIAILVVTLVSLCFLTYNELVTVRDSLLQSQLEAEYAYDYACSPSSQIVKKAEFGRNVYIAKTLWVNCGGFETEEGNFIRPLDAEKKLCESNPYGDGLVCEQTVLRDITI